MNLSLFLRQKTAFSQHIITLISGAALAHVPPLLASPLITRLYTPYELGLQAVYGSWLSTLAVLATGRYEMAIVLPDQENHAINLMGLAIVFTLGWSLLVGAVLLLDGHSYMGVLGLGPWVLLLPLSVMLAGLMQAWTYWNNRHCRYQANATGRMLQSLSMAVTQVWLGWTGFGVAGLLLGQLAGQLGSLVAQTWQDFKDRFKWFHELRRALMSEVALAYVDFPKINAPHALSTALLDATTLVVLAMLAGTASVGFYGLMMRVLKLPAALLGQAVAQVAYRELAEAGNQCQPLRPILRKIIMILSGIALLPFLLTQLKGESLFLLVFGQSWSTAGRYAEAMSLYIFCHCVASPLGIVPLVINRQRQAFLWSLVHALLFLGTMWLGFSLWNDAVAAFQLVSVVMLAYFLAHVVWLYKAAL